jgi:hypothetical protein
VIPTLRRNRDDVFLIGEESILTEQDTERDRHPTIAIETVGGLPSRRRLRSAHLPGFLQGAFGFALLGLGAAAVAFFAVLQLGRGASDPLSRVTGSSRSPLIIRSAATVSSAPAARVHFPGASSSQVHRPSVSHQHRPRHSEAPVKVRPTITTAEPQRESTLPVAPVSRLVVTPTEPSPAPQGAPPAVAESTDPGPLPSSGGGPGDVESFGFER